VAALAAHSVTTWATKAVVTTTVVVATVAIAATTSMDVATRTVIASIIATDTDEHDARD
jgi:glucan phosphoethanolaminetransferase (alkaline phosphatase superfamily)